MTGRPGQLDQISQAIGQLEGRFDGIERYMHDREHGLNNLSLKLDALSTKFSSDLGATKSEINGSLNTAVERVEARIQTIDDRVTSLETIKDQERGARNIAVWFLQSPLVGWLAAAAILVAAWWRKQ